MADEQENAEAQDTTGPEGAPEETSAGPETPSETKPEEVSEDFEVKYKEQQAKYDALYQEHATTKQQLDFITPYVNMDALKTSPGEGVSGDEETFVSKKELKQFQQQILQKISTNQFEQDFRTKYPDLGDKGPKEELAAWFFANKTLKTDTHAKRVERAVEMTRNYLGEIKGEGAKESQTKTAKNAAASGLSSTSPTAPVKEEEVSATPKDYIALRKKNTA